MKNLTKLLIKLQSDLSKIMKVISGSKMEEKPTKRKNSPKVIARVKKMLAEGKKASYIAEKTGVDKGYIYAIKSKQKQASKTV